MAIVLIIGDRAIMAIVHIGAPTVMASTAIVLIGDIIMVIAHTGDIAAMAGDIIGTAFTAHIEDIIGTPRMVIAPSGDITTVSDLRRKTTGIGVTSPVRLRSHRLGRTSLHARLSTIA